MSVSFFLYFSLLVSSASGRDRYFRSDGEFYRTRSKLTETPTDIPSEAREVFLFRNKIRTLKENAFSHLTRCESLDFHRNRISVIEPRAFTGLYKVKVIDLSINRITEINTAVSNNQVLTCAGMWHGLYRLERLTLDQNRIALMSPNPFRGLRYLQILDLARNKMTQINNDVLNGLYSIHKISFAFNDITSIAPLTFSCRPGLGYLILQANNLTTLPEDVFGPVDNCLDLVSHPSRLVISMYQNPLVCDDGMCWVEEAEKSWLRYISESAEPMCRWDELDLNCDA